VRESDVVGVKDALEGRKNYPIVLRQVGKRMEQVHYCSSDGGCFSVIGLSSAAWFVSHIPILSVFPSLHVRCIGQKKSFNDVRIDE